MLSFVLFFQLCSSSIYMVNNSFSAFFAIHRNIHTGTSIPYGYFSSASWTIYRFWFRHKNLVSCNKKTPPFLAVFYFDFFILYYIIIAIWHTMTYYQSLYVFPYNFSNSCNALPCILIVCLHEYVISSAIFSNVFFSTYRANKIW